MVSFCSVILLRHKWHPGDDKWRAKWMNEWQRAAGLNMDTLNMDMMTKMEIWRRRLAMAGKTRIFKRPQLQKPYRNDIQRLRRVAPGSHLTWPEKLWPEIILYSIHWAHQPRGEGGGWGGGGGSQAITYSIARCDCVSCVMVPFNRHDEFYPHFIRVYYHFRCFVSIKGRLPFPQSLSAPISNRNNYGHSTGRLNELPGVKNDRKLLLSFFFIRIRAIKLCRRTKESEKCQKQFEKFVDILTQLNGSHIFGVSAKESDKVSIKNH